MIDSNETLAYENGRDAGYAEGYENGLRWGITMTGLEFRNELVRRLNENANRYVGSTCNGHEYPEAELFEVDEVYEIIDEVFETRWYFGE